jgi:hypothetical protein
MPSTAEKLLLRFRDSDGPMGVTRDTLRSIASTLGVDETTAIHFALAQIKDKVLPRYERDDGPLTAAQLKQARSLAAQNRRATSTLFEMPTKGARRPAKASA